MLPLTYIQFSEFNLLIESNTKFNFKSKYFFYHWQFLNNSFIIIILSAIYNINFKICEQNF